MSFYKISVIVFLFVFAISCKKTNQEKKAQFTREKYIPIEVAKDIEFIFSDSGIVKAKMTAPLMKHFEVERPYAELEEGLKVVFYDRNLEPNAYLSAGYGIRYTIEKTIEMREHVIVVNLKGDTLTTEKLVWNERRDKVYSDKFVTVKTKDEIIKSIGFESDPTFSYYKFYNIKGTINLKD